MSSTADLPLRSAPNVEGQENIWESYDQLTLGRRVYRVSGIYNGVSLFRNCLECLRINRQVPNSLTRRNTRQDRVIFLRWLCFSHTTRVDSDVECTPYLRVMLFRDNVGGGTARTIFADATTMNVPSYPILGNARIGTSYAMLTDFVSDELFPRFTVIADRVVQGPKGVRGHFHDSFRIPLGFPVSFTDDGPISSTQMGPGNIIMVLYGWAQDESDYLVCEYDLKIYFDDFTFAGGPGIQEGHYFDRTVLPGSEAARGTKKRFIQ